MQTPMFRKKTPTKQPKPQNQPNSYIFLFLYIQLSQACYKDLITSQTAAREDLTSGILVTTVME